MLHSPDSLHVVFKGLVEAMRKQGTQDHPNLCIGI